MLQQPALDVTRILETVAQPVWVVDPGGTICFANPAAVAALGYEDAADLLDRESHATIHYKHPDGTPYVVDECPLLGPRHDGETVSSDLDWFVRKDGAVFPVSFVSAPIDLPTGRGAVVAFTDIEERLKTEQALRERDLARARAEELSAARRRIIEAADAERRRLERNLHDGAQQRLVMLALSLGLVARHLEAGSEAHALLEAAGAELREALQELRELAQGIHPALLSDRGLEAALTAAVERARLPVRLDLRLDERLPEAVEAAAYYVVCEALANTAKYAGATSLEVTVERDDGTVRIAVADDGIGGADVGGGSGLRGLADRVEALGGRLAVSSPPGGGTTLRAEIPLARDRAGEPAAQPA